MRNGILRQTNVNKLLTPEYFTLDISYKFKIKSKYKAPKMSQETEEMSAHHEQPDDNFKWSGK